MFKIANINNEIKSYGILSFFALVSHMFIIFITIISSFFSYLSIAYQSIWPLGESLCVNFPTTCIKEGAKSVLGGGGGGGKVVFEQD